MKISYRWLQSSLERLESPITVSDQLTSLGLEVDEVVPAAGTFTQVVVAEIKSIEAHPDADRLKICQVDVGEQEYLQIVCGAPNAELGLKIPCALIGAKLPDFKIKASKLRGVASQGMLCSADELGIKETDTSGLLVLDPQAPVGMDLVSYMKLDDHIIDIDLTPNRGDCFSLRGVARELSVLTDQSLSLNDEIFEPQHTQTYTARIDAPEACSAFATCLISEYDATARTPMWMVEVLRRSGIRSISPVVDVTNFIMLEQGQPLHAYDVDKVKGALCARWASDEESLELLDGKVLTLNNKTLVIGDDEQALGLAGIMGGESSRINDQTKSIILESAWFNPLSITGRARQYGLHTESSLRFERGVDFQLQKPAIERAAQLLQNICKAKAGPVELVASPEHLPKQTKITLALSDIERMLNIKIPSDQLNRWLTGLGCKVTNQQDALVISPPSWRFDLQIPSDFIEEVARLYGYEKLPSTESHSEMTIKASGEADVSASSIAEKLVNKGFYQAITYSFIDPKLHCLFEEEGAAIQLANPISSEMSFMRRSLIPGLLQTVKHNQNRQEQMIALFEQGLTFTPQSGKGLSGIEQVQKLGIAWFGGNRPHWLESAQAIDYFSGKGLVESLIRNDVAVDWCADALPSWAHPYQSAHIRVNQKTVGMVATLHPKVEKQLGISLKGVVVEIEQSFIRHQPIPLWKTVSNQPSMRRDLSILVKADVEVGAILAHLEAQTFEWLKEVLVFDVYEEVSEKDMKSISFAFFWQADSFTPTEEQVESRMGCVKEQLKASFDAIQR